MAADEALFTNEGGREINRVSVDCITLVMTFEGPKEKKKKKRGGRVRKSTS